MRPGFNRHVWCKTAAGPFAVISPLITAAVGLTGLLERSDEKPTTLERGSFILGYAMKRRTYKQLRSRQESGLHHHVYVVLLDPVVAGFRKVRAENPDSDPEKPCVYVGMTGLTPEERFANHKSGIKDAPLVKHHGLRLMPELYAHLNPMPYHAAARMEADLAEDLRREGYTVTGGH